MIKAVAREAGLSDVHPHTLRHSTGYNLVNRGTDLRLIQSFMGLAQAGSAVAVLARRIDITERGQLQPALEKVEETLGPVNILVNNAGIVALGGILDQEQEDWDRVIETNLNACFLLSKLAARSMVRQRLGKIINIASEYSLFGSGLVAAYSASKGALVQLTKSMAIELAPFNIQVNAIAPGWIDTDMIAPVKTMPLYQEVIAPTPAGRFGSPAEFAGTAVYLASAASDFVTGATLFVDGGYAIR